MVAAAGMALIASGLALVWSKDNVSWRDRRGLRVWVLAAFVVVSVVSIALGNIPPSRDDYLSSEDYRTQVRQVCNDDAAVERDYSQRLEPIKQQIESIRTPDVLAGLAGEILGAGRDVHRQEGDLLARLKTAHPPADDAPAHADLVAVWGRKLDLEDRFFSLARQKLADADGDSYKLVEAFQWIVTQPSDSAMEQEKDGLLRKLARSGCLPAP